MRATATTTLLLIASTALGCAMTTSASEQGDDCESCDLATGPSIDVVFADGYAMDATVKLPQWPGVTPRRLTWSLVLTEGDREISRSLEGSDMVAGRTSVSRTLYADFFDLGHPDDSMTDLRKLEVVVTIDSCLERGCDSLPGSHLELRRAVSLLARPFPAAELQAWGQANDLGALDTGALNDLSDSVSAAGCNNVLIAVNGTGYEGSAGADASGHFMRNRGYDCLVSVAYHDCDGGWGDWSDDDSLLFCQSADLGVDALEQVWSSAVAAPGIEQWDIFAHSKGAAAAVKFYQRREYDLRMWPQSHVFAIGLPWRMGAEYLPTPEDYQPGRIYAHGQIVAFTWANDAVRLVDVCTDLDALGLDSAHDYTPMFSSQADDDPVHAANRMAFQNGTETWVGDHY